MRKTANFLVSIVVFAVFFSCNFNNFKLPTALEVYGNPELTFSAKKDIGEMLEDQLGDTEFELITCTNTATRTHIFRKSIFNDDFNLSGHKPHDLEGQDTLAEDITLDENHVKISLDFSTVLKNFELKPVKARLYIYDSNLNEVIKIKITGTDPDFSNFDDFKFNKESVSFNNNMFAGTRLPGIEKDEITLKLNKEEQTIEFTVKILAGSDVNSAWFSQPLKADLLIWLPLEFIATDDAQIFFPDDFLFSGGDLFNRENQGDSNPISDFIESLELSINLKENAFKGRELIIWSGPKESNYSDPGNIVIKHVLEGNAFVIPFDRETMGLINDPDNWPFSPKFLFEYEKDEELIIPREFVSTEFVFKAKVHYRMKF